MKIYQVLNVGKQPASYDDSINPDALFLDKTQAEEYIQFLKEECDLEGEIFTIRELSELITVLEYMQGEDPNGVYLDYINDLPCMEYVKETLLSWESDHGADIPQRIKDIINKY